MGGGGGGGRCNFYIKNKLKSEIFTDKKVKIFSQQNHIFPLNAKIFFSVITNNSNWEILTKSLFISKSWDSVKDEGEEGGCIKREGLDRLPD